VLDLPEVVRIADELIIQSGLEARVKTIGGDYHSVELPGDNDAVIFFGVLHQEDPSAIRALLRRANEALVPGGMISILDMMTDSSHTAPKFSALFALNMALTTEHGWVFSEDEIRGWLLEAGFEDFSCRPLPPPMPHWLAWARKP
jgi:cyclopropane fatty-acyl-phospholipid synthase-like methyltransferase